MFGDWEWLEHRQDRQAARFAGWLGEVNRPVVVEVGAGTSIPAVRHLSQQIIHDFGGRLVRINSREFSVPTKLDVGLASGARNALAAIDGILRVGSSQ